MRDPIAPPPPRELLFTGLLGLIVVFVAVAIYFGPGVLSGREVFFTLDGPGSDFWHLNYPFRAFYAESLAEGELPLWCHRIGTGYPLLADGQVAAVYPPNLLLYSVLPLRAALNWEILLHLILAGVFAAMFARQQGAGRSGSVLAGLVFSLSGFLIVHLKHTNMLTAAAWLPLILLLMERFRDSRRAWTFVLLSAVIGASCIGGHPQIAYYNLLIALVFGICLLVGRRSLRHLAHVGGGWLLAVVFGVALATPQILPTMELKDLGPRKEGLSLEEATEFAYAPRHFVLFFDPFALGNPAAMKEIPGPDGRTRYEIFDPGEEDPAIFWETTGYVGLLPIALAILAFAFAKRRWRLVPIAVFVGLSLLLALGTHVGVFTLFRDVVPGFDSFRFPGRFLLYVTLGLAVLGGIGLSAVASRLPARIRLLRWLALPVCFVNLYLAFGDHNRQVDADRWFEPPAAVKAIREMEKDRTEPFRIASLDPTRRAFHKAYHEALGWSGDLEPYVPAWNCLHANLGGLYGLTNLDVHSPSPIVWARDATGPAFWAADRRAEPQEIGRRIASLFNVRYFIHPDSGVEKNPKARPRAFLTPVGELARAGFVNVIDHPPVKFLEYSAQRVQMAVEAPQDCWLFLSDTFYPGWQATVDGETAVIHRANIAGRAVDVPAGKHEVEFRYRPTSFRNGLWIAAAAAIGLVALLWFSRRRLTRPAA